MNGHHSCGRCGRCLPTCSCPGAECECPPPKDIHRAIDECDRRNNMQEYDSSFAEEK